MAAAQLDIGIGGLTFDFPGSIFQWTGGVISTSAGDLTNLGTMNLAGSNDKDIFNDGTLDNFGTIIQTGSGNLGLHSDGHAPTTLKIERGASYLIGSDSGVDNPAGNRTSIVNEGTIEKTAGSGTSTILVNGTLSNTGTIQAGSVHAKLSRQRSRRRSHKATTLTAGTWNDLNGSTLEFPSGTSITTNQASITSGRSGAAIAIAAMNGLASNSGNLAFSITRARTSSRPPATSATPAA